MPRAYGRPVANGLRTDHPIPGLPFVDDSHIPVDDSEAIEAVGRYKADDMWGREDSCSIYGGTGWAAFTTDPLRHDLGWAVRWHPERGRSVVLYRDDDTPAVHQSWEGPALLFRCGGYWLHESGTWYRPSRIWDAPSEDYYSHPVAAAITVTAADILAGGADAGNGRVMSVTDVDVDARPLDRWEDHLAWWADNRAGAAGLSGCVVTLAAPELAGDQLIGMNELAQVAGIAPSTLRAYLARGEADVPEPQAIIGGRSVWARQVASEWAEQRRRDPEGLMQTVTPDGGELTPGMARVRARLERMLMGALWEHTPYRHRWALRWRSREAVQDVAEDLSKLVTADLQGRGFVDMDDLSATLEHALMDELAYGRDLHRSVHPGDGAVPAAYYGITPRVERLLSWLIGCDPVRAGSVITAVVGEAERRLDIPRAVTEYSLRVAATSVDVMDSASLRDYLDRVMSPERQPKSRPSAADEH